MPREDLARERIRRSGKLFSIVHPTKEAASSVVVREKGCQEKTSSVARRRCVMQILLIYQDWDRLEKRACYTYIQMPSSTEYLSHDLSLAKWLLCDSLRFLNFGCMALRAQRI